MYLHITNEDKLDLDNFCNWLIPQMREYLQDELEPLKLSYFDNYLNNKLSIDFIDKSANTYIACGQILLDSINSLTIKKINNQYIIALDENIYIPNTYIRLIDLIKLVNYGNLILRAYPIYDSMMEYFANNIEVLYDNFLKEL